jgi:tetratricopeptide (TPR) repeat protein
VEVGIVIRVYESTSLVLSPEGFFMIRRCSMVVLLSAVTLTQSACITKTLVMGQVKSSRKAAPAVNEIADYEIARTALQNSLATLEGMNHLVPEEELIYMQLTRSWVTYGFVFAQDDMESAEEGSHSFDVAKARTLFAYERAVTYGLKRLAMENDGFSAARKNEKTLVAWLGEHFDDKEDAELMFWFGYSWLARVSVMRDKPEAVAELWVGVKFLEHSLKLDPDYNESNAITALAAYHARASMAELDEAKTLFEQSLAKNKRMNLLSQVNYATRYACLKGDRELYDRLLAEVVAFDISLAPRLALPNTVAKRRAHRALQREALAACGFDPTAKSTAIKPSDLASGEVSVDDFMAPPAKAPPPKTPEALPAPTNIAPAAPVGTPAAGPAPTPQKPPTPPKPPVAPKATPVAPASPVAH